MSDPTDLYEYDRQEWSRKDPPKVGYHAGCNMLPKLPERTRSFLTIDSAVIGIGEPTNCMHIMRNQIDVTLFARHFYYASTQVIKRTFR